jgi:hypothetical protein
MELQSYQGQHYKDQTSLDNGASLILGECKRPHDNQNGCMVIHKVAEAYVVFFHEQRGAHDDKAFTTNGRVWFEARQDQCERVLQALNYANFVELLNRQLNI